MTRPHISVKGAILTVVSGVLVLLLGQTILGMTSTVREAWHAKADTSAVNQSFRDQNAMLRSLVDSVHATHLQVDSLGGRVREFYCAGKAPGCR